MNKSLISFVISLVALLFGGCADEITNINGPQDWQPPEVKWLSPPDADVRGTVGLDVSVQDSSRVTEVRLYLDGREQDTVFASPYRFEVVTDSLLDGVHLCEARAWDEFGNMGVSPILRINFANSIAQGPRVLWVPDSLATIQAAINAAQDFDTIRVRDGTYYETLNTFGKGLWIESEHGPLTCTIDAAAASNVFFFSASRELCTIRGFQMVGAAWILLGLDDGSRVCLFNNITWSDTADGLLITGSGGGLIQNNLFSGCLHGLQFGYFWGFFYNNIVQNVQDYALWNAALSRNPLVYGYNLLWNNGFDYNDRFAPGVGDVHADPQLDLQNGRLLPGSPAIDAGHPDIIDLDSSRSDIGPFGGPWAYTM